MCECLIRLMLCCVIVFVSSVANADDLTPSHEPNNASFYVCYKTCQVQHIPQSLVIVYRKYNYLGCSIQRSACHLPCLNKHPCKVQSLKTFGWFNNYIDTLNAFYRCAYS